MEDNISNGNTAPSVRGLVCIAEEDMNIIRFVSSRFDTTPKTISCFKCEQLLQEGHKSTIADFGRGGAHEICLECHADFLGLGNELAQVKKLFSTF